MSYTEPTFCADCHEPISLCQCGDAIDRPDYDALAAENAALKAQLAYAASTGDECAIEVESLRARLAEAEALFDDGIINESFGPRCDEYEAGCACCRAWRWLDGVKL